VSYPRAERLAEFLRRLDETPPAASFDEAYDLLCEALNTVEDEMSGIPYNPARWRTDGRLYPPAADSMRSVPNPPAVKRFRSRGHNTFIASNGAIEIRAVHPSNVVYSKAGSDGCGVWEMKE